MDTGKHFGKHLNLLRIFLLPDACMLSEDYPEWRQNYNIVFMYNSF